MDEGDEMQWQTILRLASQIPPHLAPHCPIPSGLWTFLDPFTLAWCPCVRTLRLSMQNVCLTMITTGLSSHGPPSSTGIVHFCATFCSVASTLNLTCQSFPTSQHRCKAENSGVMGRAVLPYSKRLLLLDAANIERWCWIASNARMG